MRTFKQHIKENKVGQFYEPADDNINPAQLSDPEVLRKINAFVGSVANQSYVLPEQAINVIRQKLNRLGIGFGTLHLLLAINTKPKKGKNKMQSENKRKKYLNAMI